MGELKFNNRSWELNRFKGLYPGVIEDLEGFNDAWLAEMVDGIQFYMIRKPLDFDTPEGVEKLKELVSNYIKTWNEASEVEG